MPKTTIIVPDKLWKEFSIKVIRYYGERKKVEVLNALIDGFVNHPSQSIAETIRIWMLKHKGVTPNEVEK